MIIELNTTILSPARRPIPVQSDCDISEVENVDFIFYKPSVKKFAEGRVKAFLTDLRVRLLFYLSPATRTTLTLSSDVLPLQRPFSTLCSRPTATCGTNGMRGSCRS